MNQVRVFDSLDALPRFRRLVVTVGSFDGVHAGHRELIGRVVAAAGRTGGESVVVTFWPHPRMVLGNMGERVELLSTPREKALLLSGLGVDNLIVVPFTPRFSRIGAEEFVRDYLVGRIGLEHLVVGFNHHFGHGHSGGFGDLEKLGERYGFSVEQLPQHDVCGEKVSSTLIRRLIRRGEMAAAARFLGAPYIAIMPAGENKLLPPPGDYTTRERMVGEEIIEEYL